MSFQHAREGGCGPCATAARGCGPLGNVGPLAMRTSWRCRLHGAVGSLTWLRPSAEGFCKSYREPSVSARAGWHWHKSFAELSGRLVERKQVSVPESLLIARRGVSRSQLLSYTVPRGQLLDPSLRRPAPGQMSKQLSHGDLAWAAHDCGPWAPLFLYCTSLVTARMRPSPRPIARLLRCRGHSGIHGMNLTRRRDLILCSQQALGSLVSGWRA